MMAAALARLLGGVSLVASSSALNTGTTIIGSYGSGITGDVVVAGCVPATGGSAWTPPSGWTEQLESNSACDLEICTTTLPNANNTFTYGTSNNKRMAGAIFRKAAVDATGAAGTLNGTGTCTAPSVTLSKAGMAVLVIASTGTTVTHTPPAGWDLVVSASGSGYPSISIYKKRVGAGATGTVGVTIGGTPGDTTAAIVGLIRA